MAKNLLPTATRSDPVVVSVVPVHVDHLGGAHYKGCCCWLAQKAVVVLVLLLLPVLRWGELRMVVLLAWYQSHVQWMATAMVASYRSAVCSGSGKVKVFTLAVLAVRQALIR